jgi:hypothetical protein
MSSEQKPTAIDEQATFLDGAKHGHIMYRQVHQGTQLTPRAIYDLLMKLLLDTTHPSVWNAGYITGWFLAKYQAGDTTVLNETLVGAGQMEYKGQCFHWSFTIKEEQ